MAEPIYSFYDGSYLGKAIRGSKEEQELRAEDLERVRDIQESMRS